MKIKLLKKLRNRFFWKIENNQWIIYDRKQNKEIILKVNNSNDALINTLVSSINEPFIRFGARKPLRLFRQGEELPQIPSFVSNFYYVFSYMRKNLYL